MSYTPDCEDCPTPEDCKAKNNCQVTQQIRHGNVWGVPRKGEQSPSDKVGDAFTRIAALIEEIKTDRYGKPLIAALHLCNDLADEATNQRKGWEEARRFISHVAKKIGCGEDESVADRLDAVLAASSAASTNNALAPGERKPGEIAGPRNDDATSQGTPRTLDRASQEQAQPAEGTLHTSASHATPPVPDPLNGKDQWFWHRIKWLRMMAEKDGAGQDTLLEIDAIGTFALRGMRVAAQDALRDKIDTVLEARSARSATRGGE